MIVIRSIQAHDLASYIDIAFQSHINFYSLPKDEKLLTHQLEKALISFSEKVTKPDRELYIFVAEDSETKKLLGVSALAATTGGNEPLFFYRRELLIQNSPLEPVVKRLEVLNPVSYLHGPSEVCSLFVEKLSRGTGVGKLLSLSRFLFAAKFPERFTESFISELRGKIVNGTSPFWEGVGRRFFDLPFEEVQKMMAYGRSFINHFLPAHPLYVALLPEAARDVIGKVDSDTEAALSLLSRLGFEVSSEVDVLDAGPKLVAKKEFIRPIAASKEVTITKIQTPSKECPELIISNENLEFRAVFGQFEEGKLAADVASELQVQVGDTIRIYDPKAMP